MSTWIFFALAAFSAGAGGFIYAKARTAARMRSQMDAVRGELSALQQLALTISDALSLDHLAEEILEFVQSHVDSEGVLVALAEEDAKLFRVAAAGGTVATLAGTEFGGEDAGLLKEVIDANRLVVSPPDDDGGTELVAGSTVGIAAAVPLEVHGKVRGVLAAVRSRGEPLARDELRQLMAVAAQASMALAYVASVEMLRRGKEQWEAIFDALSSGVAVVDEECRILRANEALAEILGRPVTAVAGLSLCDDLPGDSTQLAEFLAGARNGRSSQSLTHHSDHPERRFRITASQMPGTRAESVVVLIEDVTEQEQIEEKLIQSEKMAAVGQLVSGVAHDLNNPITSIAGVADLLLNRETAGPSDREHVELIRDQAERASRIVRNLLTFARKEPVGDSRIDVNEIVRRAADLTHHEMNLHDVNVEFRLGDDLPGVRGDGHELQQVVLHLLTNAIQAMSDNPNGRPRRLMLTTSSTEDRVTLEVSDTGAGIDAKLLPQIFLPFVTTKPAGQGTGLGLSIAYRIVQAHNGTIEAHQASEGGSRFTVSLPCGTIDSPASANEPASLPETTPAALAGELCVLVLESDTAVQRSLRLSFSEFGHSVDATRDASQAFSLLRKNDYDLIVADAKAENSAGVPFAEELKSNRPELCSRTILTTADVRAETDAWLQSLGCRYLRKPFDPAELRAAAAELLAERNP